MVALHLLVMVVLAAAVLGVALVVLQKLLALRLEVAVDRLQMDQVHMLVRQAV